MKFLGFIEDIPSGCIIIATYSSIFVPCCMIFPNYIKELFAPPLFITSEFKFPDSIISYILILAAILCFFIGIFKESKKFLLVWRTFMIYYLLTSLCLIVASMYLIFLPKDYSALSKVDYDVAVVMKNLIGRSVDFILQIYFIFYLRSMRQYLAENEDDPDEEFNNEETDETNQNQIEMGNLERMKASPKLARSNPYNKGNSTVVNIPGSSPATTNTKMLAKTFESIARKNIEGSGEIRPSCIKSVNAGSKMGSTTKNVQDQNPYENLKTEEEEEEEDFYSEL